MSTPPHHQTPLHPHLALQAANYVFLAHLAKQGGVAGEVVILVREVNACRTRFCHVGVVVFDDDLFTDGALGDFAFEIGVEAAVWPLKHLFVEGVGSATRGFVFRK